MNTAIIIGGGLGGLFTGAILAKEGYRVTVLEKNATAGGGLQTFCRFGAHFDTGMHVIGGMRPGGNILRICRYLGIDSKVRIKHVDDTCTDSLYFAEDRTVYRIARGRRGFVDSLSRHFPDQRDALQAYVDAVFAITDGVDLFNLRPSGDSYRLPPADFLMAADAFVAKYIGNPRLRSVVAYMNPLYGGRGNETPAYIHAIITALYIEGASRFVGGSSHFADLLTGVITGAGGAVLTGDGVRRVEVTNRHVDYVETEHGHRYRADSYIAAIHPSSLLRLVPADAFPKAYRNRIDAIPNAYSAYSVYVKLKPRSFPYINHSEYYMTRYDEIWNFGQPHDTWPLGFLFMTPPDEGQGPWASKALITAPMLFDEVRPWQDTVTGRRGPAYAAWKERTTRLVMDRMEELHPGFAACVDRVNDASPLTIRDYYGVKEGALSGFSKDYRNMALSQVPVVTKVDNLLLTGQNNNLHGFCGVPLTAITTAEVLLGRNCIINKINACENAPQ